MRQANAAITKLINFQGKLTLNSNGTNVPDGNYSFQFKIYDAASSGNLLWTETWDGGTAQIAVTNGVFSAKLGTYTSLDAVDFATKTPFLSVNFNPGGGYDGEMSPRKELTAASFAFNANNLVGDGRIDITYAPGTTTNPGGKIVYNPSVSSSNNALYVSAGSNVTGAALNIIQAGSGGSLLFGATALAGATQTYLGANPAAFSGNFIDLQVAGSSKFKVNAAGAVTAVTGSVLGTQTFTTNNIADSGALTIASGGGAALTLNSASNALVIDSSDTTLTASGVTTLNCSNCINFDDIADSLTLDGASGASSLAIDAANTKGITLTSSLSAGNRTVSAFTISQANNVSNTSSAPLLQLTNADTDSIAPLLQLSNSNTTNFGAVIKIDTAIPLNNYGIQMTGSLAGTGIVITGTVYSGYGISMDSPGTGRGIGIGVSRITGGAAVDLGNSSGVSGSAATLGVFSGNILNVGNHLGANRTLTSGTLDDTGNFVNVIRTNVVNGGTSYTLSGNALRVADSNTATSGTMVMSADTAAFSRNCSGAGTCTDSGSVLSLTQSYASGSGAVLKVTGAGTGVGVELAGAGAASRTINSTSAALVLKTTTSGNITLDPQTGIVSGVAALTLTSGGTSNLTIDSNSTGALNLGTGNSAKTISIGTGNAGNTINIGTNNTVSDTISIGSVLDNVSIVGDQWSITDAGVLTVVSCTGCGGGSPTPWTQDIDGDNFSLLDLGTNITARAGLTIASTGAGGLALNSASGAITSSATTLTLGGSSTINGGTGSGNTLTLVSSTNGTKGDIQFFSSSNRITSAGALTVASTITAATTGTINGININSGAVSGLSTLGLSGAITGATATNTINGLIINSGALSGITTLSASSAIAANGGITFDNSTDTLGAHTLAGTVDANLNILTNIGNSGTDFVASTGALTLAGILTANGGISIGTQALTGTTGIIDYTNFDVDASGNIDVGGTITAGSANTVLTLSTGKIDGDALTLAAAADGGTGTSSGSGLMVRSDGIGLLQGCSDGQVLQWVESTDTWDCATVAGGSGTSKFVVKGSNENVASGTTLQSDNDLTFAVSSSETWIFHFHLRVTNINSATPDWKAGILGASGWTCAYTMSVIVGSTVDGRANGTDCDNAPTAVADASIIADASIPFLVNLQGSITTTSSGSVTLQWAANTSGSLTVMAGSYVIAQKVGGSDLAEIYYTHDETIEAGDVVSIDSALQAGVKKSQKAYDPQALGIISTRPGLLLGDENSTHEGLPTMVALSGRVPVKVTAENGMIEPGDLLTPSSIPGVAMRASKAGSIIGQALTGFSGEGVGQIMVFIKTGYANGSGPRQIMEGLESSPDTPAPNSLDAGKILLADLVAQQLDLSEEIDLSEIFVDRASVGLEVVTPRVITDSLVVDKISSVEDYINLVSNLIFIGRPYFNNDTGGFAVIQAGQKKVQITFETQYLEQPVVSAEITLDEDERLSLETDPQTLAVILSEQEQLIQEILDSGIRYFVVNKSTSGFWIILNKPAEQDIKFSWVALAVKNAKTFKTEVENSNGYSDGEDTELGSDNTVETSGGEGSEPEENLNNDIEISEEGDVEESEISPTPTEEDSEVEAEPVEAAPEG